MAPQIPVLFVMSVNSVISANPALNPPCLAVGSMLDRGGFSNEYQDQKAIGLNSAGVLLGLHYGLVLVGLVAPYRAIPRDYLSDTPLLRAMGFLVSQHGQKGAIPPPPFLTVSPFESMRNGGAIPPLKRGISAILARYPMKARQMGAIPPSAILSRKGIARYGWVSRTGPLSWWVKPT